MRKHLIGLLLFAILTGTSLFADEDLPQDSGEELVDVGGGMAKGRLDQFERRLGDLERDIRSLNEKVRSLDDNIDDIKRRHLR